MCSSARNHRAPGRVLRSAACCGADRPADYPPPVFGGCSLVGRAARHPPDRRFNLSRDAQGQVRLLAATVGDDELGGIMTAISPNEESLWKKAIDSVNTSFEAWDSINGGNGWSDTEGSVADHAVSDAVDYWFYRRGEKTDPQCLQLSRYFAASQADQAVTRLMRVLDLTESPIERTFAIAMASAVCMRFDSFAVKNPDSHELFDYSYGGTMFVCLPQHRVGDYRVDFLCQITSLVDDRFVPVGSVIVECDGHDFHERTKEQARRDRRRDRSLQAAGFTVFRFAGSEIFADPFKCAGEVISFLEQLRDAIRPQPKSKEAK